MAPGVFANDNSDMIPSQRELSPTMALCFVAMLVLVGIAGGLGFMFGWMTATGGLS